MTGQAITLPPADRLRDLAIYLSRVHTGLDPVGRNFWLLERLDGQERMLRAVHQHFTKVTASSSEFIAAAEWLLDNFYLVEETIIEIRQDLPKNYYQKLPGVDTASGFRLPRVFEMAWAFMHEIGNQPSIDQIVHFLHQYQSGDQVEPAPVHQGENPLCIGELWALPTMLRLCLIERLAQATARIVQFAFPVPASLALPDGFDPQVQISSAIPGLRILKTIDWTQYFNQVSIVEQILNEDPVDVYPRMDFESRDHYRKQIEQLANWSQGVETDIARVAIQMSQERWDLAKSENRQGEVQQLRTGHVGFYLVAEGRGLLEKRFKIHPPWPNRFRRTLQNYTLAVYGGVIGAATGLILLFLALYAGAQAATWIQIVVVCLIGFLPAVGLAVNTINNLITHLLPPRAALPKHDFRNGIPADYFTLVVIPALLTDSEEISELLHQLELNYLGNSDENVQFALLTDFPDAPEVHLVGEDQLLIEASAGIDALNQKYSGDSFLLLHRQRKWNPAEGCWMGWERKRGKLAELNRLIRGDTSTSFSVLAGSALQLQSVQYVITLDADSHLLHGSVRRLIATMTHPLNQAIFDPLSGRVVAGYTILQPRLSILPSKAQRTLFSQIFSGGGGIDLYSQVVSDVYQDLFAEGNYMGKGIYHVDSFERSLKGKIPDNTLLSHDLFEGLYGRAGVVSDVILYEDFPHRYLAFLLRMARWIRGDWQLLPWLGPKIVDKTQGKVPNRLSPLGYWKIIDNLRRSLTAPGYILLLVGGWLWLPGEPLFWTALVLAILALPGTAGALPGISQVIRHPSDFFMFFQPVRLIAWRWLLDLAFLPYQMVWALHAIVVTLVRLLFTRQHLLEWTTAAHIQRRFETDSARLRVWMHLAPSWGGVLGLGVVLLWARPEQVYWILPIFLLWLSTPEIAHQIGKPRKETREKLTQTEIMKLRAIARRTWLFFEQFIGPEDNWLAPDHFQEDPKGAVTHQTSPTNIGLALLTTLGAYDLGYTGLLELQIRITSMFDVLTQLEKYNGHLLNWYDTRNLRPLPQRYVSTVDSGNYAGCLIALRQGFYRIGRELILRAERWQGLVDTLEVLQTTIHGKFSGKAASSLLGQITRLQGKLQNVRQNQWTTLILTIKNQDWPEIEHGLTKLIENHLFNLESDSLQDVRIWIDRVRHQIFSIHHTIETFMPWEFILHTPENGILLFAQELRQILPDEYSRVPSLEDLPGLCQRLSLLLKETLSDFRVADRMTPESRKWMLDFQLRVETAGQTAEQLLFDMNELARQAETFYLEMDFRFLFDTQRHLFHIGFNVDSGNIDANYYDLFASEARLASIVAIAKGDVPERHWLFLWRPVAERGRTQVLMSWSGSMFEYLMPALILRHYPGSMIEHSNASAVAYQMAYGQQKGVPWGISESGFYLFDSNLNYQYQAFGVPSLGLKRGLEEDLVIAPYASLLALPYQPRAVLQNLDRLSEYGMLGIYGYYESLDFTPSRQPIGRQHSIIKSYMVHHQAMALLSLVNFLCRDVMVERLHSDPRIESCELLLQEQIPAPSKVEKIQPQKGIITRQAVYKETVESWQVSGAAPAPLAHVISNGRYSVVITANGSGFSQYSLKGENEPLELTRWRADATLDDWGQWLYLRDLDSGETWSGGHLPVGTTADTGAVYFFPHQVEFQRTDHQISVHTIVTVSIDDDAELRKVSITNHSAYPRRIRMTSYAEVALQSHRSDSRHPAFSRLFVESETIPQLRCLLFKRRVRSVDQAPIFMAHCLVLEKSTPDVFRYECDRNQFIGRGGTLSQPSALQSAENRLSSKAGATLDPILAIGQDVILRPRETRSYSFITLAAQSRGKVVALAKRYQLWSEVTRAFDRARSAGLDDLERLRINLPTLQQYQRLLSALLYPNAALRAPMEKLRNNRKGQRSLWSYTISGDYPILLVKVWTLNQTNLFTEILTAHRYWRNRGVKVDLVCVNMHATSYDQQMQGQLLHLISHTNNDYLINQRGGIFLLRGDQIPQEDLILLETAARVVLDGEDGNLAGITQRILETPTRLPAFISTYDTMPMLDPTPELARPEGWQFDNGTGGFSLDGKEYGIYLPPGRQTPAPWVNVLANPEFGCLVSAAGLGFTWAENSSENRLTPWHNDPVRDPPGEAVYLRDEETGQIWSPTPLPVRDDKPYLIYHGAGYSTFDHHSQGLLQHMRVFTAPDAPVKVIQLRLKNSLQRVRRVTVTYYAEWTLGPNREHMAPFIIPEFDSTSHALLASNPYNEEFSSRVAFLATTRELHGLTTDRTEFLGSAGSYQKPAGLGRMGLSATVQAGLDPCAALQVLLWLAPGEEKEVTFLLGQGKTRADTQRLIGEFHDFSRIEAAWYQLNRQWEDTLGAIQVKTPNPAFDLLINRWLLYQTLACRIWARSAFYQSGGAYGFRDQLQDVMALVYSAPQLVRSHLLNAAERQFQAGDVLHWWHPPSGRGIRTRCSDNLIWLPFVTAHYVSVTGDQTVLDEEVPFLAGSPLETGEMERYDNFPVSAERATLFEHCIRALERGITSGPNGLPLIGAHDWNDGLNQVGVGGKGESIWLGWFLYAACVQFATLCRLIEKNERSSQFLEEAEKLRSALETRGWDGNWYLRAFFDDGSPLGSEQNQECQIDSIAQSWAVLSNAADPERARQAMRSVEERLVSWDNQLIQLFDPPFDQSKLFPGYLQGYPPGVRENGGQYTHAAIWTVWAFADLGESELVEKLFDLLNPILHSNTPEKAERYRVEPYVIAADIYSKPPHTGRGGWTWYTGSAGWMYRLGIEKILGIHRRGDRLMLRPCVPVSWAGTVIHLRFGENRYRITFLERSREDLLLVDGKTHPVGEIQLADDGQAHTIEIGIGP